MTLTLKNVCVAGSSFTGKSKFDFWMKIEAGDVLEVSLELKPSGRSSRGMYAPVVKVENLSKGGSITESFNLVQQYLGKVNIVLGSV